MKYNSNRIFTWLRLIIKLVLALILLPFWLIYLLLKYLYFKYNFKKELKLLGLDKRAIKDLSKEIGMARLSGSRK